MWQRRQIPRNHIHLPDEVLAATGGNIRYEQINLETGTAA